MSELVDLVGILGAVDDEVVERPELLPIVAALLCPYRSDAAVGWFQPFREWWATLPGEHDRRPTEIPTLDAAVTDLTIQIEPQRRDLARRLLAVAVLSRVFPDYGPDGSERRKSVGVLAVPGLAGTSPEPAAQLLELLANVEVFPDLSVWDQVLADAVTHGFLSADALQPPPCQGDIVEVEVAGHDLVATAIKTHFCTHNLTFERASGFLDPARWPECLSFWCHMDPLPGDPPLVRFLETVGLDCDNGPLIRTGIDFRTVTLPDRTVVGYRMSDDQPACGGDGHVLIDEGSLEVCRDPDGGGVCVTTTKRVLFDQQHLPLNPYQLGMLSCALGYADVGAQLVYNCAQPHAPTSPLQPRRRDVPGPAHDEPDECTKYIDDVATAAKDCVTEWSRVYRGCYCKATSGRYASDDITDDFVGMYRRTAGEALRAIELGLRGLRVAAGEGPATRRRSTPPGAGDPVGGEARSAKSAVAVADPPAKEGRKNQKGKGKP